MPETKYTVMISSTSLDLPEHRKQAIEACQRLGFVPIAMEHLPGRDADAATVSLEMVDRADLYLGIFAWRYGFRPPDGGGLSITEMEFDRAVERGIPILPFTPHQSHPLTFDMVETEGDAQTRLTALKAKACTGRIRREFKSPEDLRGEIIHALSDWKERELKGEKPPINFHPPNLIPAAPAPYIAHPYSLLQTGQVVGRRDELKLLTDWVTRNESVPASVRLFNVVAIGGMGKSALTWKWFNEIAPNELPQLAGRMWWSFYESDAYFENFVIRALAYTSGMTETEVRALPPHEREDRLFYLLDTQPFLLVLDGLERILLAYARMDAAHLADDDLDERTANDIADDSGLPDEAKETYQRKHHLRQCSDPRAGRFLRRLTQVRAARVLVSTRLYPAELQTVTAQPRPGCYALFLNGLSDDDALALWRAFIGGARSGTSERLLPCFRAFGNYPLLLRALAGEVAEYRPAPGDFDRWLQDHPNFNPAQLDLRNARTHVLSYALEGLRDAHIRTLQTLAAFRMPATWETLCAVLIEPINKTTASVKRNFWGWIRKNKAKTTAPLLSKKACPNVSAFVVVLAELEDRGLVGWDKVANRYDLHPIVRGVIWDGLTTNKRKDIYEVLHSHFRPICPQDWNLITPQSLEDLAARIELYSCLVGLERYDEAVAELEGYMSWLVEALLNAGGGRELIKMLEMLFPEGTHQTPRSRSAFFIFKTIGMAYDKIGEPCTASGFYQRISITGSFGEGELLFLLSKSFSQCGELFEAECAMLKAIFLARNDNWSKRHESKDQELLSKYFLNRGLTSQAWTAQKRACKYKYDQSENIELDLLRSNILLTTNALNKAREIIEAALSLISEKVWYEQSSAIKSYRLLGTVMLRLGDITVASDCLHHSLTRARIISLAEEELPTLIALAELRRQQGQPDAARELLDDVWEAAERGPYPLFHADAMNVLAQLERDAGNTDKAIAAATAAYRHAWCDGPPYAYHWGLVAARRHLQELGAPEPQLPPFDPTQHEPMPEVEINPRDEFYVEVGEEEAS